MDTKIEFFPAGSAKYIMNLYLNGSLVKIQLKYSEYLSIISFLEKLSHFKIEDLNVIEVDSNTAKKIVIYTLLLPYVQSTDLRFLLSNLTQSEIEFWNQTLYKALLENRLTRTVNAFLTIYQN